MNHRKILTPAKFVEALHELTDQHLKQAISIYQNLSEEKLNQPSREAGWSIAQCLEHLNSYSRHYLPLIKNEIAAGDNKSPGMVERGWLGNYFIKMMDPDLKASKYKAAKGHLPVTSLNAYQVVAEFIRHQEELIILLAAAATQDLNRIRIPTSLNNLIRLRLGDTFIFLAVHNERHIRQANQNLGE